jgi:signal transduction histidine kinase
MSASASAPSFSDFPQRSITPTGGSHAFLVVAWGTVLVALSLIALGVLSWDGDRTFPPEALIWIAVVTVVDLIPMPTRRGARLELDLPVLLAGAFIFGPVVGGLIALLGAADRRELRREIPVLHALFNRSQTALSVMAAGIVFHGLGFQVDMWPAAIFGALMSLAADMSVNYLLVSMAIATLEGVSLRSAASRMTVGRPLEFIATYAAFGTLGLVLVAIYEGVGPWGLLGFVLPIALARQAFHASSEVEERGEQIREKERAIEEMTNRVVEERSDERARIATVLHDDVLQGLYYVTLHAHVIKEDIRTGRLLQLDDDLPGLMYATQQTSDTIRDLIAGLRKSTLGPAGLTKTLHLLVQTLTKNHGLPIEAAVEPLDLPPSTQLVLYQVAQEALHNAVRHSRARSVRLTLYRDQDFVRLCVSDDGQGFAPEMVDQSEHFGLVLMRERVTAAQGDVQIQSQPGGGTVVAARIPVHAK